MSDIEAKRRRYFDELYKWLADQRMRLALSPGLVAMTMAPVAGGTGAGSGPVTTTAAAAMADAHLQSQLRLIKSTHGAAAAAAAAAGLAGHSAGQRLDGNQADRPGDQQQQQPQQLQPPRQRANPNSVYGGRLGIEGYRFRVAPIWRRVVAELVDGLLLLVVKICLMIVLEQRIDFVVDSLLPVDNRLWKAESTQRHRGSAAAAEFSRRFGGNQVNDNGQHLHYHQHQQQPELDFAGIRFSMADLLSPRLILLDLMVRLMVLFMETVSLCGCFGLFRAGQTPGKWLLNLQVVQANDVIDLPDYIIEVLPASPLGFQRALARSAIKNLAMMFFFPVWATAFVFSNHRTSYDIITSTIVVENLPPENA